ncbi:hypothetical protein PBY51_002414 [Eleginops maclovinus]|uniref:Uncharacterized protein n=1 Tax=Eleginops maclovinus TaxID=56733 RepID=A0AAN7XCQ7_ELEMC|nr:hypothetical protein PBY51_002414 [Eleginops maclovinus]
MTKGSTSSRSLPLSEVLNIINQEMKCYAGPGFEELQYESSLEIEQAAGELTRLMAQNVSIVTFLAKEYVKVCIHQMATQTRRKYYHTDPAVLNRGSLQLMVDKVWDVLLMNDMEQPEEEEEVCVVQKFKDTVPARIPEITQTLADLLSEFVISSSSWQQLVSATNMEASCSSWPMIFDQTVHHDAIKQDIRRDLGSFLEEMSLWMIHNIQVYRDKVQQALMKYNPSPPTQVPEVSVAEVRESLVAAAMSGPVCEETPAKRMAKRCGALGPTISEVFNILSEDVIYVLSNVLISYELSDSELKDLAFESSLNIEQVAGEINELMDQHKSIGNTIRTLVAKEYVKANIHCMVIKTIRKYLPRAAAEESRRSIQMVVDKVWDVLLKEDLEAQEEGEEVCVVQKFKDTISVRMPEITETLADLLSEFLISGSSWQQLVSATCLTTAAYSCHTGVTHRLISDETATVLQDEIKQDFQRYSGSFLKEMTWWMNYHIQVHIDKVQQDIIKASSATPTQSNSITIPTKVPEVLVAEVRESLEAAAMSGRVCEETPAKRTAKRRWAFVPTISEVLNVLSKNVNDVLSDVLTSYELSDSELKDLAFESSLKVKQVAGEITALMDQQKSIGDTIRTCLAMEYVKVNILAMVIKTRREFYPAGADEMNRASLQLVVVKVWDVLFKEDGVEPEEREEVCVVQKFKDTVPVRLIQITQTIFLLLSEVVNSPSSWHQSVTEPIFFFIDGKCYTSYRKPVPVRQFHYGMKKYIQRDLGSFLFIMSWWMDHKIQVHSDRVQQDIIKAISAPPTQSNSFTIPTQVPEVLVAVVREPLVAPAVSGPVCEETPAKEPAKRRGAFVPTISEVLNVLSKDVNDVLSDVLTSYELSDSEFEDLAFESSLKVEQVAGETIELMDQQKSIGNTIRTLLAMEYVKANIHCMVTQTSREYYPLDTAEESRGSLQLVVDKVWDVLLKKDVEQPEEGEEVCVVQNFKDTVPVRIPEIIETHADLLSEFVISSSSWHQLVNATNMAASCGSWPMIFDETVLHDAIKQDIRRDLGSFLEEMSLWMIHKIQVHSERVQQALMKHNPSPPTQVPEVLIAEGREPLAAGAVSGLVFEEAPAKRMAKRRGATGPTISEVFNIQYSSAAPTQVPEVLIAEGREPLAAGAVSGLVFEEAPATPRRRGAFVPVRRAIAKYFRLRRPRSM